MSEPHVIFATLGGLLLLGWPGKRALTAVAR